MSVNAQVEFLLRRVLTDAGRIPERRRPNRITTTRNPR
jgi:hypothetical protein